MKKLLALLLVCLLLLGAAACQKSAAPETSDAVAAGAVSFGVPETVFEEGTKVTAETVTGGAVYERAKTAVQAAAPVAQKFTVFEFNAVKDEAKVQPNGTLAVTFRIPDDYSNNVKILYVADDGATEEIAATVNAGERTVVAELTHFSTYVLIDLGGETVTTTESATTTAPTTTTTQKPTTTTAVSYSAFKSHDWLFRVVVEDGGKFCRTYTLVMTDGELRIGEASSSPYEEMIPPEYRDEEKPDFEFSGIQWYTGAGGYVPLTSVKENGKTITLTDEDGKQLVLTRTGENTVKAVSNTIDIVVKAGDVFTVTK